jgi:biopolymer transport protein ExbD
MKRRSFGTPEITPLIDVVFLLLVFFMVSSVFKRQEPSLALKLPESSSITTVAEEKELKIEMTPDATALNGEGCTLEELGGRLSLLAPQRLPVVLYIDETVSYKRIMALFDLLQKHGFSDLALISEKAPPRAQSRP